MLLLCGMLSLIHVTEVSLWCARFFIDSYWLGTLVYHVPCDVVSLFCCFEAWSPIAHCVAEDNLEVSIFSLLPPKCRDHRQVPGLYLVFKGGGFVVVCLSHLPPLPQADLELAWWLVMT